MKSRPPFKNVVFSITIGIVYLWFGALKFFPNLSPAEALAKNTISRLTADLLSPDTGIVVLAIWETSLGLMLLLGWQKRWALRLAIVHMVCTFTLLIFFPSDIFGAYGISLSLTGQYIIKNLIILSVLVVMLIEENELYRRLSPIKQRSRSNDNRVTQRSQMNVYGETIN